jgi:hypothetical protein
MHSWQRAGWNRGWWLETRTTGHRGRSSPNLGRQRERPVQDATERRTAGIQTAGYRGIHLRSQRDHRLGQRKQGKILMNIRQRAREQRAKEAELLRQHPSGDVFLTAVDGPGVVAEVPVRLAAGLLISQTHRVSTPAEIANHLEAGRKQAQLFAGRDLQHNDLTSVISALTRRSK